MREIRFIDLFAGVGGFRLGLERANEQRISDISKGKELQEKQSGGNSIDTTGQTPKLREGLWRWFSEEKQPNRKQEGFRCVWTNEWDKYAIKIYNKQFGTEYEPIDITGVHTGGIPNHDLLCGGFPCQAFSIAGKRKGFEDTRGTMFFEIARILRDKKPKMVLLENVKGLLSHDGGRTLGTILDTLRELGYVGSFQVLNSKNFGVAQNRERIFIFGFRGETAPQVFPLGEGGKQNNRECVHTIDTGYGKGEYDPGKGRRSMIQYHQNHRSQGGRIYKDKGIGPTLTSQRTDSIPKIFTPMRWVRTERGKELRKESMKDGKDYTPFNDDCRELQPSDDNVSGCITGALNKDALLGNTSQIRRLTPIECERLQGFPDNWSRGLSDTQRYKTMGNAVTVNVIQAIGERILEVVNGDKTDQIW